MSLVLATLTAHFLYETWIGPQQYQEVYLLLTSLLFGQKRLFSNVHFKDKVDFVSAPF